MATLLSFWTDQKNDAQKAAADAQTALKKARGDLDAQRDALAKANAELAALAKQIAQIRADLAKASAPADVNALAQELSVAIADTRAKQAQSLGFEEGVTAAQTALDMSTADLAAATSRAASSAAALKSAGQRGQDRARLRASLTLPPLDTLPADATAALADKPFTDAQARIANDLPQELRDCAEERRNVQLKRAANNAGIATEATKLLGAVQPPVAVLANAFNAAESAFRDYAVKAADRLTQALAIAARVADKTQNPLSPAEIASIQGKKADGSDDNALQKRRSDAAAAAKAVATAQIDLDAKTTDVQIARLDAIAKDVDGDPEKDAAVIAAEGLQKKSQDALDKAVKAFDAPTQQDLSAWELTVPDTAWQNFADFGNARDLLNGLQADPGPLVTAMDTAEASLVVALVDADTARRLLARLEREAALAAAAVGVDGASLPRRELGALRGDS